MLDHISFGVGNLARAARFYDAALLPLGIVRVWTVATAVGYGEPGQGDRLALKERVDAVRPGPGFHVAFAAPDEVAVDAFYAAALSFGGTDAGPPGLRPHYGQHYYAAFVIDPDGHRVEAVFHGGA